MKLSERLEKMAESPYIAPFPTRSQTLREAAELARRVEGAHRTYVNSVYDTDAEEDRGEVLSTLPKSLVGFVRIVPEQGEG